MPYWKRCPWTVLQLSYCEQSAPPIPKLDLENSIPVGQPICKMASQWAANMMMCCHLTNLNVQSRIVNCCTQGQNKWFDLIWFEFLIKICYHHQSWYIHIKLSWPMAQTSIYNHFIAGPSGGHQQRSLVISLSCLSQSASSSLSPPSSGIQEYKVVLLTK